MDKNTVVLDAKSSPVHQQNWEVCIRMLVHDLIDISETNLEIKKLLKHYDIAYFNGGFTLSLPRLKVLERNNNKSIKKHTKKGK